MAAARARKPAAPREPNPLFDAVAEIFELNPAARRHAAIIGMATRDLMALGATPTELKFRVDVYKKTWPGIACTPRSIVDHWNTMRTLPADANRSGFNKLLDRMNGDGDESNH